MKSVQRGQKKNLYLAYKSRLGEKEVSILAAAAKARPRKTSRHASLPGTQRRNIRRAARLSAWRSRLLAHGASLAPAKQRWNVGAGITGSVIYRHAASPLWRQARRHNNAWAADGMASAALAKRDRHQRRG
jgi:hypothetical protein